MSSRTLRYFAGQPPFASCKRMIRSQALLLFRASAHRPRLPEGLLVRRAQRFRPEGHSRCNQRPLPVPLAAPLLGFFAPPAPSTVRVLFSPAPPKGHPRHRAIHTRRLAASRVSHPLDGFLLAASCRSVSPSKHSWGFSRPVASTTGSVHRGVASLLPPTRGSLGARHRLQDLVCTAGVSTELPSRALGPTLRTRRDRRINPISRACRQTWPRRAPFGISCCDAARIRRVRGGTAVSGQRQQKMHRCIVRQCDACRSRSLTRKQVCGRRGQSPFGPTVSALTEAQSAP
jgi:hypothetical protein